MDRDQFVAELTRRARALPGVTTVALFGSSTDQGAGRRDQWSDVDFAVFTTDAAADQVGREWAFLPDPEQIVLAAREYDSAGVVLYFDGSLAEFGAGRPWPVSDASCQVVFGGADVQLVPPPEPEDPANAIRLCLAKLAIGAGRARRGERLAASSLIRQQAPSALAWAVRGRLASADAEPANSFDPLRRFEVAYPELAERLDHALAAPVEQAARDLLVFSRDVLEPGWTEFPSRAADLIAERFGWTPPDASATRG
ncbi:hypothetical protein ATK74_0079 [Propionicimonas paludicola]|uniref:Nucleotidyltransferase-like protein n=1 Tax=Propionicimonas paludicola TaxID=185243 RepID=A0A2A9CPU3_9ACTN|nr:hypothetical protein [Propionicimonas paludicola]PFG15559.1 hypothetical protein ATK74_0079 [Propionicimonas paludicola]